MKKFFSNLYLYVVFFLLYCPIFVMIVFSFNSEKGRAWKGFSLNAYTELFRNEKILTALLNTLIIAVIASIFSTVLGTLAAIGINNMKKVPRMIMKNITYMPNVNPEIITGVSLMLLFTSARIGLGYATILISHITFCVPCVVLSVLPKLRQLNMNIYEAAMDLGCSKVQAFFKVVLPEIMPGIITGALMAITYSIDDFVISYFTSGASAQTLPIEIWSMTKKRVGSEIYALSTIMFVAVLAILLIVNIRDIRKDKKIKKAIAAKVD